MSGPETQSAARYRGCVRSSLPPLVRQSLTGLALGGAAGALLQSGADTWGTTPWITSSILAWLLVGAAAVPALHPPRWTRPAAALTAVLVAVLGPLLPDPLAWAAVAVAGALVAFALGPLQVRVLTLAVGALAVPVGAASPLAGCALLFVGAIGLEWLGHDPHPAQVPSMPARAGALAVGLGGGALLVGGLTVGRALDPTWGTWVLGLVAGVAGATVTVALKPRAAGLAAAFGALIFGVWLALSPGWMQQQLAQAAGASDPRLLLVGCAAAGAVLAGVVIGAGVAMSRDQPLWPVLGAAGGVLVGAVAADLSAWIAVGVAGGIALVAAAAPGTWPGRAIGGLTVAVAAGVGWWMPLSPGPQSAALTSMRTAEEWHAEHTRSAEVAWSARSPDGALQVETNRRGEPTRALIDGTPHHAQGRAADAASLAGHLGAAVAHPVSDALVLGDVWGWTTAALVEQRVDLIHVSAPAPELTRQLAERDPSLGDRLLDPGVRLQAGTSQQALRALDPVDLIIEVVETPWHDSAGGLPTQRALTARARGLREGGAYVLVVPVAWMTEGELRGLLGAFDQAFAASRAFLPASGGDSLIVVGLPQDRAVSWTGFAQAATMGLEGLAALNLQGPLDLADRSLTGAMDVAAIGGTAPDPARLPAVLHRRPRMLLPVLADLLDGPEVWLDTTGHDAVADELTARVETSRRLLDCLDNAARGQIDTLVGACRGLAEAPDGARSLDPLIAPQLLAAEEHLVRCVAEGPRSSGCQFCLREVQSAKMLHPNSTRAHTLGGQCELAIGDDKRARASFEQALGLDEADLDALLGMAVLQNQRGELAAQEQTLRRAIRYHPRDWRPHWHLGSLLLELGRLDEAEEALRRARTEAGAESTRPLRALAQLELVRGNPQEALLFAQQAANKTGAAPDLHLVGTAYFQMELYDAAEQSFRKAILADPTYWLVRGDLGACDARAGRYASAIENFDAFLANDPTNAMYVDYRQRAVAALEQAGGASQP